MNWSIEFFPLVPEYILWAAGALSFLLAVVLFVTSRRGAFLRALCFALLIAALAGPHFKQEKIETLKNIAVVVLDESSSQSVARRKEITEEIRRKLRASLEQIQNLEVRWVRTKNKISSELRENTGTTLFSDLKKELSQIPANLLSGIFLVTDGQIHDAPKKAEELGIRAPVHVLLTGNKHEYDQRIEVVQAPRFGLVGSRSVIKVRIEQYGDQSKFSNEAVVYIRREKQLTQRRVVDTASEFEIPITFPHAGANFVEIELQAKEGELTQINNRVAIVAQGVRENLRVLLVSGEPHAGERTWRNLLKSDASVDLVHFTILRPPEKLDGTPINQLSLIAFPTRELFSEKLHQFDLIIFDRYRRRGVLPLLYLDNIARYVKRGGAILVAAGKTFSTPLSLYSTPLSQILPASPTGQVIEQPYRAKVTDEGRRHPVTRNLPGDKLEGEPDWGRWFRLIQVQHKSGDVLMNGHNRNPLLILNRLGKGRVALLVSDHAWLWARGYEGGGPYITLLRRLAHWLMKEPDLEEEFLGAQMSGDIITVERRSMKEEVQAITVQTPDGRIIEFTPKLIKPGVWRHQIKANLPGLYRFKSGKLSALAHTGTLNSLEMSNVAATSSLLQPVLKGYGGGTFWPAEQISKTDQVNEIRLPNVSMLTNSRAMSGKDWMGLRDRNAVKVLGVQYIPVFSGLLALALLAGLISVTWFREGR